MTVDTHERPTCIVQYSQRGCARHVESRGAARVTRQGRSAAEDARRPLTRLLVLASTEHRQRPERGKHEVRSSLIGMERAPPVRELPELRSSPP